MLSCYSVTNFVTVLFLGGNAIQMPFFLSPSLRERGGRVILRQISLERTGFNVKLICLSGFESILKVKANRSWHLDSRTMTPPSFTPSPPPPPPPSLPCLYVCSPTTTPVSLIMFVLNSHKHASVNARDFSK